MAKWTCKIVDFPRNCELETVVTCSTTDGNSSCHESAPSFVEEMTRCQRQKHCCRRPGNPNGSSKFCKYRVYLPLLCLFTSMLSRRLFHGWWQRQLHTPAPSYFEEMTRCRHQNLHWRRPGNPNDRSKFRNLRFFTFTRLQLMLRRRLRGWWRFPEIAQTARSRSQNHHREWSGLIKILETQKFMPMRWRKNLEKLVLWNISFAIFTVTIIKQTYDSSI